VTGLAHFPSAWGHEVSVASAKLNLHSSGDYQMEISLDITASPDPAQNDEVSPEQAALEYLSKCIELRFDEHTEKLVFSGLKPAEVENQEGVTRLYCEHAGKIPKGAKFLMVHVTQDTTVALVMAVFKDGIQGPRVMQIYPGEFSAPPIDLSFVGQPVIEGDPFATDNAAAIPPPTFWKGFRTGLSGWGESPLRAILVLAVLLTSLSGRHVLWQAGILLLAHSIGQWAAMAANSAIGASEMALGLGLAVGALSMDGILRGQVDPRRLVSVGVIGFAAGWLTRGVFVLTPEFERSAARLWGQHLGSALGVALAGLLVWVALGTIWSQPWYRKKLQAPVYNLLLVIGGILAAIQTISA